MEKISPKSVKDIEMSRFRSRSRSSDFREFGLGKKVSDLVSENLVSEKSIGFGKFGLGKKNRFRKILYWKKSLGIGQNFGIVIQCHWATGRQKMTYSTELIFNDI